MDGCCDDPQAPMGGERFCNQAKDQIWHEVNDYMYNIDINLIKAISIISLCRFANRYTAVQFSLFHVVSSSYNQVCKNLFIYVHVSCNLLT